MDPYGVMHYTCDTCGKYLGGTANSQVVDLSHMCGKDDNMSIEQLPIPEYKNHVGLFGSSVSTDPELLKLAQERGFHEMDNAYNQLAAGLFFGGASYTVRRDVEPGYRLKCVGYVNALLQSFEPKHEDKMAVAALVLHEVCEPIDPCVSSGGDDD